MTEENRENMTYWVIKEQNSLSLQLLNIVTYTVVTFYLLVCHCVIGWEQMQRAADQLCHCSVSWKLGAVARFLGRTSSTCAALGFVTPCLRIKAAVTYYLLCDIRQEWETLANFWKCSLSFVWNLCTGRQWACYSPGVAVIGSKHCFFFPPVYYNDVML